MIRLRYSPGTQELELQGTRADLVSLKEAILGFCADAQASLEVTADGTPDPSPYSHRLSGLRLVRTKGLVRVAVDGNQLTVSGNPACLEVFAGNLPVAAEHPAHMNYHVHFDSHGMETWVSSESLEIVLTLRRGPGDAGLP